MLSLGVLFSCNMFSVNFRLLCPKTLKEMAYKEFPFVLDTSRTGLDWQAKKIFGKDVTILMIAKRRRVLESVVVTEKNCCNGTCKFLTKQN